VLLGDVAGHKDVVVALLGASAGLAGFALVFYGLVLAGYQSLPTTSSGDVRKPWQDAIHLILGSFVMGLVCSALAVMWLVDLHDNRAIYLYICCRLSPSSSNWGSWASQ
jgi:hypothetical protein